MTAKSAKSAKEELSLEEASSRRSPSPPRSCRASVQLLELGSRFRETVAYESTPRDEARDAGQGQGQGQGGGRPRRQPPEPGGWRARASTPRDEARDAGQGQGQ